jgi:hypothetical protein
VTGGSTTSTVAGAIAPGDLVAPPPLFEELGNDPATVERVRNSPEEDARRRTGAIAIAGTAAIGALGTALGLRERAVTRRRVHQPTTP